MSAPFAVRIDPVYGCWLWTGRLRDGYGVQGDDFVYRRLWRETRGPIPPGVQLDHMCRRRACVRPEHMDPVSRAENLRRTHDRHRRALERCPIGHLLGECGLSTPEGGIVCRVCCNLQP
jgi:hypothetical protein